MQPGPGMGRIVAADAERVRHRTQAALRQAEALHDGATRRSSSAGTAAAAGGAGGPDPGVGEENDFGEDAVRKPEKGLACRCGEGRDSVAVPLLVVIRVVR